MIRLGLWGVSGIGHEWTDSGWRMFRKKTSGFKKDAGVVLEENKVFLCSMWFKNFIFDPFFKLGIKWKWILQTRSIWEKTEGDINAICYPLKSNFIVWIHSSKKPKAWLLRTTERLVFDWWLVYTILTKNRGKIELLSLGFLRQAQLSEPQPGKSKTSKIIVCWNVEFKSLLKQCFLLRKDY